MSHHDEECGCCCCYPYLMVGREAPDFALPSYQKGKFGEVKLSDYKGKWVVLFFYPEPFYQLATTVAGVK